MKRVSLAAALIGGLAMSSGAFAATDFVSNKHISQVSMYGTYAVIRIDSAFQNTQGCDTVWAPTNIVLDWYADPTLKTVLAGVLVAYSTGKAVTLAVEGCHPWGGGVTKAYRIDLK